MEELNYKLSQLRLLLAAKNLNGLVLQKYPNVAWVTCGATTYVNSATDNSAAVLLITPEEHHLITNNIEAPRLLAEEALEQQGWTFNTSPWFGDTELANLTRNLRLGSDGGIPNSENLSADLARLRLTLQPAEEERFRSLGRAAAHAMDHTIRAVQPGMSEFEIAGRLADATLQAGALAIVNLVAADERIFQFRHPLPTTNRLQRYAMLVLCARRDGLIASMTRLIHFGPLPDEITHKAQAVAAVDAAYIAATRPGAALSEILQAGQQKYAEMGFPEEWRLHHQGGPTGYSPREGLATPSSTAKVGLHQAYAWNPSIAGVKSEDTILVTETGHEILTATPGWPEVTVPSLAGDIRRPAILVVE